MSNETKNTSSMLEVRKLLGLTQGEMASALGWTTHNHVVRIEKGRQPMTALTALALECLVRRKKEELERAMHNKPKSATAEGG